LKKAEVKSPRRIATRCAYDGKVISVDVDTVQLPTGATAELEMVRHPGASAIVGIFDAGQPDPDVLLVRQFRYAAEGELLEIPAGRLERNESPIDCARRELREETGYRAGEWREIAFIYSTPGFTDERLHLFLASGLTEGEAEPDHDEVLKSERHSLSDALSMIESGVITDAKTIVGLLLAKRLLAADNPSARKTL
jgi:ADP-ribose pyrophosphatase